jgi:hypothetical protein
MDNFDRKTLENIKQYGCSVIHVAEEDNLPPFAYSIGIKKSSSAPEVVVIGLKTKMAHSVINEYNRRIRDGEVFKSGDRYAGFLEGFDVLTVSVESAYFKEYLGYNLWFYDGPNFEVL